MAFPIPDSTVPRAPTVDCWIEQLGRRRNDTYAWMKYIPAEGSRTLDTLPPGLRDHLLAEMGYADAALAPLEARRKHFFDRLHARVPESVEPPPLPAAEWRYGYRLPADSAHRVHLRTSPGGVEEILFDEADRAEGHAYYRTACYQESPDHRYFAWAEDVIGNDRHRICILDMRTGTITTAVEADAYGYGGLVFSPSSRFLFWIWRDVHSRPTRLYRTTVDSGETALVYEEEDPAIFMQVARTAAGGFVVVSLGGPDKSEVRLIAAAAETAAPRVVRRRERGVTYEIDEWAGSLLMLTDADGAIDRKVLLLDAVSFEPVAELLPHREGISIIALMPFAEALVLLERENGLHRLGLLQAGGREIPLRFDDPAYAISLPHAQEYRASHLRIVHQTPISPPHWIDICLRTGERRSVRQEQPRDFDTGDYVVERLEAPADDGQMVPLTLLFRRDTPADAPLLLTGYGAYGISSEPNFSLEATVLADAGFRYAIAHVRGGSEKGRRWFLDGRRFNKRNSMTDFIACARHLCAIGHTQPGQIVADGLSAGGLMTAGALNIDPELWAGMIAEVPFVDMLNTMSDADHPLVPLFRPDWGDPLSDAEAYDYIASISPYENVRLAAYPPMLCTAGLKDDRVPYWEPAKLIAAIREKSLSDAPAILLLDPESGHQSSGDRDSRFAKAALFWAFAEACIRS